MNRGENRKVRSDKKRDVKPTIEIELKDAIYRLSYVTQTPVKDVCDKLIYYAINDIEIMHRLARYFVRDMRINNTLFIGNNNNSISKRDDGETERINMRLIEGVYRELTDLAFALDCRPSRVCAILLKLGMKDFRFINNYVKLHVHVALEGQRKNEHTKVLLYTNKTLKRL